MWPRCQHRLGLSPTTGPEPPFGPFSPRGTALRRGLSRWEGEMSRLCTRSPRHHVGPLGQARACATKRGPATSLRQVLGCRIVGRAHTGAPQDGCPSRLPARLGCLLFSERRNEARTCAPEPEPRDPRPCQISILPSSNCIPALLASVETSLSFNGSRDELKTTAIWAVHDVRFDLLR